MARHSTVTCGVIERKCLGGPAVALSAAITLASRAPEAATFYVRDESGEAYGRVERLVSGDVEVYRTNGGAR